MPLDRMSSAPKPSRIAAGEAPPECDRAEELRFELRSRLIEADRVVMQVVQTSLSLIGFGFTINAFFNDAVSRGLARSGDVNARRLGASLLMLGVVLLAGGIWSQARYRRDLYRRYRGRRMRSGLAAAIQRNASPAVATAILLLGIGLAAVLVVALRGF